ncbi:MAG: hypothetical protein ACI9XC_002500 [Gammaproteobacteria bacterium]|jgi:hypothetical protein
MRIRQYEDKDKDSIVSLWREVFPSDPAHNEALLKLESKVDYDRELIFVA